MYESGRPVNRCSTFSPSVITATPAAPATAPCHSDLVSRPIDLHPLRVARRLPARTDKKR
jgi:hypothetical protein